MTKNSPDFLEALNLIQSLAEQFASELDLNHDAFPRDRFGLEMDTLGHTRTFLSSHGVEIPTAVNHVLAKCAQKMS